MWRSACVRLSVFLIVASPSLPQVLPESPSVVASESAGAEQVRLSEILITTPQPYDPAQVAQAQSKAEEVHRAIQKGARFDELAKTYSQGPTAAQGGDLGYFRHGQLASSLEELVFGMKVGEVSGVVRTKQGFVILRVAERGQSAQTPPEPGSQTHGQNNAGARSDVDVLSDTLGVDFGPYLQEILKRVKNNWYNLVPDVALPPLRKQGTVTIEFTIMKDGRVTGMKLTQPSGDVSLDRAAWGGITASNPFPALPTEYSGKYLVLRFRFQYNPSKSGRPEGSATAAVPTRPNIAVQPGRSVSVRSGKSQKFSVVILNPVRNGPVTVRWSVAGPGCKDDACGTISADGLYTAPLKPPDPAFVTVTAAVEAADPPITDSVTIEIVHKDKTD